MDGQSIVLYMIASIFMLVVFVVFFPRLMLFQIMYKMRKSLDKLQANANEAENMFLEGVASQPTTALKQDIEPMKNMVVSPPTGIDPTGLVPKLESVLDTSDDKMEQFVDQLATKDLDEEQEANMVMSFKGVYGTQQIYVMVRHLKELIESTKNFQLGGMMQMMLPLYEEIAESQRDATEAFVNEVPIGDSVGPLIAANFMQNEPDEIAEDVIVSEETVGDDDLLVLKSKGPGSRLGKYGDAIEQIVEDNDISKLVFVDAGMRLEGEETGKIVNGTGVLMGGPGVEKYKIEEIAADHDIPLEGFVVKQSGPQASKPMHRKIYDAVPEAVQHVEAEIAATDGTVLLVGVGNTVGVGNSVDSTEGIDQQLQPYWEEQEEESTSYFGLMQAFPMGGGGDQQLPAQFTNADNTFELFQSLVR